MDTKLLKVIIGLLSRNLNYENFRYDLGKSESSNNYSCVNTLGFLGRYQFGMARLCDLGLTKRLEGKTGFDNKDFEWCEGYSKEKFLSDHNLQDEIFDKHLQDIYSQIMRLGLYKYIDFKIREIKITLSGMIAGSHLGGVGGVKTFLTTGFSATDAYGGTISNYIKKFAGYNMSIR
jgi:hypothetical protein